MSVKSRDTARAATPRPQARPTRPGLAEVRAEINRVDHALVRAIVRAAEERAAPFCGGVPPASVVPAGGELPLETPHMTAPHRALGSVRRP
ncbi:hypothetical protein CU044_1393 [Streptomyces sp. L-9-10]|uniref:hypothetical protein n=1 Tax=Streptomyces sp. L-9-10 TaxID=1478131 RepID=UPI00101C46AB|nr:hypothetical protein [Streptomyces sp. L-9-10]RYJ30039.1 hypothetical protein CU044_1393 [Streptomyces sp. L-9-10]